MGCTSTPSSEVCRLDGFIVDSSEYRGLQSFLPDFKGCFVAESSEFTELVLGHELDIVVINRFCLFEFEDTDASELGSVNVSKGGA